MSKPEVLVKHYVLWQNVKAVRADIEVLYPRWDQINTSSLQGALHAKIFWLLNVSRECVPDEFNIVDGITVLAKLGGITFGTLESDYAKHHRNLKDTVCIIEEGYDMIS